MHPWKKWLKLIAENRVSRTLGFRDKDIGNEAKRHSNWANELAWEKSIFPRARDKESRFPRASKTLTGFIHAHIRPGKWGLKGSAAGYYWNILYSGKRAVQNFRDESLIPEWKTEHEEWEGYVSPEHEGPLCFFSLLPLWSGPLSTRSTEGRIPNLHGSLMPAYLPCSLQVMIAACNTHLLYYIRWVAADRGYIVRI